jgi:hypothetical protein
MAAFAAGCRKNEKYPIRNAAAVQYCSLLEMGNRGPLVWRFQVWLCMIRLTSEYANAAAKKRW